MTLGSGIRAPRRALEAVTTVFFAAACDPLVGGECALDHVPDGRGRCVAVEVGARHDQGGGGGRTPATGGSDATTSSAGGGTSTGGDRRACALPDVACGDRCVDLTSDANHCGGCFNACASGLCDEGICLGDLAGHVVFIGMSYATTTPATRTLLGNATFLPTRDPIRVLSFTGNADPSRVTALHGLVAQQAQARGRTLSLTASSTATTIVNALDPTSVDTLLVHEQRAPSNAGSLLRATAESFVAQGGTVVVTGTTAPTGDFLVGIGLVPDAVMTAHTGLILDNVAPASAVGVGLPSILVAPFETSKLTTSVASGAGALQFVVTTDDGAPVVIHRTVAP
ncbi:MAG: hypothetical protein AAF715_15440 [Myxococcota bacterium]